MAIPFKEIPAGLLVPGQYQEVDMSLTGGGSNKKIALCIGQMRETGAAEEGREYIITAEADGRRLFGEGSDLALMLESFLEQNKIEELRAIGLKDKSDGAVVIRKITFETENLKTGTVPLYINGINVSFGVSAQDSLAQLRNKALAAVNSKRNLCVEAAAGSSDGELLLSHVHKGETGNTLDVRFSLFSEALPEGLSAAIASQTPGSGNPDISTAIRGMQEIRYNYILCSIHDAANMLKLEAELDRRYTAMVQKGCRLFIALSGTETEMTGYADAGRNNPHISVLARGLNPESEAVWLGRGAGIIIRRLADDPAANINGEKLKLIASHALAFDSRQRLLEKGISTYTVGADGLAYVERQVTMYTEDKDGNRDTAYLDIQIPETINAIREHINKRCAKEYAGYKLSRTNENFGAGSKVMTPSLFKSFLLATYQQDFIQGKQWYQNFKDYKETLIVSASQEQGKTRIDYRHRPELIGQFMIAAGLLQAR